MTPLRKITGFVGDPKVPDNAFLDPMKWEFRTGKGSGVPRGLRERIGFDKMVNRHEVPGHAMVTEMAPGHNLNAPHGDSLHEKIADMIALAYEYIDAANFAGVMGRTFTVADVQKDARIIGSYSLDGGIRSARNTKRYPNDEVGEPHDDSLMPGGAGGDLLESMIVAENDVLKGAMNFVKLQIAAVSLVPVATVTFQDELRALITADQSLFSGANNAAIVKCYGDHGISLTATRKKNPQKKPAPAKSRPRRRRAA